MSCAKGWWFGGAVAAVVLAIGLASWWGGRPARHLERAERRLEAGRPDEALRWLRLPESRPETRPRALLVRARAAVERGRPAEAVRPLEQIDPDGPLGAEVAFWKGRTLREAGQVFRAAAWFREALRMRPDDPDSLRWLAATTYELGDISSSIESLERLVLIRPDDAPAWRTMGLIHKEHAEYERSRDAYRAALRADPDQPDVRMELAEVLMELSRHDEAIGLLEACRGRVDEPARAALLARSRYEVGQRGPARDAIDEALARSPGHPTLMAERARIDLAEGDFEGAVAALDAALASEPTNEDWFYLRSQALRRLGQLERADADLARSRRLTEIRSALSDLIREADQKPADAEVRYRLGSLCAELNDPRMAASWFRAALACDPGHEAARLGLMALQRP